MVQDLLAQDKGQARPIGQEPAGNDIDQAEKAQERQSQEDLQAQLAQVTKTAVLMIWET